MHPQYTLQDVETAFAEFTTLRMIGATEALKRMKAKPGHATILLEKFYAPREIAKDLIRDMRAVLAAKS